MCRVERCSRSSFALPSVQPVRWALNLLHKAGLRERVYGPELMFRLCRAAAELLGRSDERERPLSLVTGFYECTETAKYSSIPPPADRICIDKKASLIEGMRRSA